MNVIVGVPTYMRPQSLRRTLESLASQERILEVLILVVDNDPDRSASEVIGEVSGLRARYICEPRPGVVHVRNRLLEAAGASSCLIFVDDDETVSPGWLDALLEMHSRYPDNIVTGPVEYSLSGRPIRDPLLATVFATRTEENGATIPLTGTGNSLIPTKSLNRMTVPRFDSRFSSCGGEDTDFFSRFVGQGGTIRWCSGARVVEHLSPSRATHAAALRRVQRKGYSNGILALEVRRRTVVLLGAVLRILVGFLGRAFSRNAEKRARDEIRLHYGWGRMKASLDREIIYYGMDDAS